MALTPNQEKLKEAALAAMPGPWEQGSRSSLNVPHQVIAGEGSDLMVIMSGNQNFYQQAKLDAAYVAAANPAAILAILAQLEQVQGDARLIAAAQNLLTALELAIRVINNECDPDEYAHPIAEINAAITKATAGQPLPQPTEAA